MLGVPAGGWSVALRGRLAHTLGKGDQTRHPVASCDALLISASTPPCLPQENAVYDMAQVEIVYCVLSKSNIREVVRPTPLLYTFTDCGDAKLIIYKTRGRPTSRTSGRK